MNFTTNEHPKRSGDVLHDDDLADAIVDRILLRGRPALPDGHVGEHQASPERRATNRISRRGGARGIPGIEPAGFPERTGVERVMLNRTSDSHASLRSGAAATLPLHPNDRAGRRAAHRCARWGTRAGRLRDEVVRRDRSPGGTLGRTLGLGVAPPPSSFTQLHPEPTTSSALAPRRRTRSIRGSVVAAFADASSAGSPGEVRRDRSSCRAQGARPDG
jgi:hypothetical protein